ncbi:MAG: sugar ABC transporter permease [Atribacterota bacterium]
MAKSRRFARKIVPFVFLSPFLIMFVLFRVWPIVSAFHLSFQELKGIGTSRFVGISNYTTLLSDRRFVSSFLTTSYYTAATLLTLIPIPLVLSVLLFQRHLPGRNLFRTLIFLPSLTSLVVVGTVFRLILADTGGLVNTILGLFGVSPLRWLLVPSLAVPSLTMLALWRWTGMNIVYFSSGLTTIPSEVYEAARLDGAEGFSLFRYITVPMIKPIIVFVITISIIGGYQVFVEPYILYPGGRTPGEAGLTVAVYLYRTAFRNFNMGYAAAIGVVLAGIIFVVSLVQFQVSGFFRR